MPGGIRYYAESVLRSEIFQLTHRDDPDRSSPSSRTSFTGFRTTCWMCCSLSLSGGMRIDNGKLFAMTKPRAYQRLEPSAGLEFIEPAQSRSRSATPTRGLPITGRSSNFLAWVERAGYQHLEDIEPITVAAYIETLQRQAAPPTVKHHMAAIRMMFSWLTEKDVLASAPW